MIQMIQPTKKNEILSFINFVRLRFDEILHF